MHLSFFIFYHFSNKWVSLHESSRSEQWLFSSSILKPCLEASSSWLLLVWAESSLAFQEDKAFPDQLVHFLFPTSLTCTQSFVDGSVSELAQFGRVSEYLYYYFFNLYSSLITCSPSRKALLFWEEWFCFVLVHRMSMSVRPEHSEWLRTPGITIHSEMGSRSRQATQSPM